MSDKASSCRTCSTGVKFLGRYILSTLRDNSLHLPADIHSDSMDHFPKALLKKFSTSIAIAVVFIYNNVLDKGLSCACNTPNLLSLCYAYLFLPFFILFILHLWMNKFFSRLRKNTRNYLWNNRRRDCLGVSVHDTLKAGCIGALWVVSLLIDGDWYVCCTNNQTYPQSTCQSPTHPSDQKVIEDLKNRSMVSSSWFRHNMSIILCLTS